MIGTAENRFNYTPKGDKMKEKDSLQVFLWRGPDGKIQTTKGESANQAAGSLGAVLSWDDHDTVTVMYRGRATNFKLQPRGAL